MSAAEKLATELEELVDKVEDKMDSHETVHRELRTFLESVVNLNVEVQEKVEQLNDKQYQKLVEECRKEVKACREFIKKGTKTLTLNNARKHMSQLDKLEAQIKALPPPPSS